MCVDFFLPYTQSYNNNRAAWEGGRCQICWCRGVAQALALAKLIYQTYMHKWPTCINHDHYQHYI